ncbi:restriction endonuclease subunit S [Limosilactobacillus reuteri]|uniref:restriction endonuclease subunit S n=1 Tax=Limosilactobacillus reuteri TaxID=1598 RepID=UPI003D073EEF
MYFSALSIIFIKVRINVKWEQRKLGEISTSFSGGTPSVKNKSYYGGKIPFIRSAEIHKDKTELFITENGLKNSSAKLIKKGTLLYALYGATSGEVDVSNIDGAINQAIMAIFLQKDNVSFIKYYLEKNKYKIIAKYLQGGQGNLSASIIKSVHINLPFTEEQLKISNLIKKVESLISLQQRKLEQLKQLKKAMLQQLFVDKNNKQPNSRFKNFKGNWEQHRLEEVAQVTMGQSPSSKNYTDNPNDYVLVQGNADLKSNKISPRVWTKEITKQVHKGEIIMTVRAPVGYLAMANMDAVIGRGVAAIDGNKYLYYLLQTKLMDRTWEKLSSGSTFESISSNDIKNLEIKVTETEEEKLITKLMNTVTYFVTLQKNNLTQLTTLKKYLLQNLFI